MNGEICNASTGSSPAESGKEPTAPESPTTPKMAVNEFAPSWEYCSHDSARSQQAVLNFSKHKILPCTVQRMQVAQYIKRQQINSIMNGNYKKAEYFYETNAKFCSACRNAKQQANNKYLKQQIEIELKQLNEKKEQINENKQNEIEAVLKESRIESLRIEEEHDKKIENFVKKWEREDVLYSFSKPSINLQELREKEKNSILTKNFEIAARLKKEADELEKIETDKAQELAENALRKEREEIDANYFKQKENLERITNDKITKIECRTDSTMYATENRIRKLEMDMKIENFPEPKETAFDIEAKALNVPMAILTPRTRQKYLQFKEKPQFKKLKIHGRTSLSNAPKIVIPRIQ